MSVHYSATYQQILSIYGNLRISTPLEFLSALLVTALGILSFLLALTFSTCYNLSVYSLSSLFVFGDQDFYDLIFG